MPSFKPWSLVTGTVALMAAYGGSASELASVSAVVQTLQSNSATAA